MARYLQNNVVVELALLPVIDDLERAPPLSHAREERPQNHRVGQIGNRLV